MFGILRLREVSLQIFQIIYFAGQKLRCLLAVKFPHFMHEKLFSMSRLVSFFILLLTSKYLKILPLVKYIAMLINL